MIVAVENDNGIDSFLRSKLGDRICAIRKPADLHEIQGQLLKIGCNACEATLDLISRAESTDRSIGVAIREDTESIVAAQRENLVVAAMLPGSPDLACQLFDAVLDSYDLLNEVHSYRAAMEESAMQLAQSFEEQNWLRGFARQAVGLQESTSADEVARIILQPMGYLLRAESIFLLVNERETERSGMQSARYGESQLALEHIEKLLNEQGFGSNSKPLVKNNVLLSTSGGNIRSIVAVNIHSSGNDIGCVVGINRSTETHSDGLPVYDPEFGSGDVGLLEEAGILLATQVNNIHLLAQSNELFLGSLHAMSSSIDARDPYTQGHSERVARLGFDLAKLMGLSDEACQEIYLSGILHDIGKIGIPDAVLLKAGSLTDDEFAVIQKHPEIGYRILERLGHLHFVLPGVLHHHERWDGAGYPHGLAGDTIPLMARVLAVADAFDAMTSSRPYRNAMPLEKAKGIICSGAGQQWDADVVDCFKKWLGERSVELASLPSNTNSIIPHGSPIEHVVNAVMTLGL